MGLSIDEVIATNIKTFLECFELTKINDETAFSCRIDGCHNKYSDKSSSIRHLRKHHKEVYDTIKGEKLFNGNVNNAQSTHSFEIRVKVNSDEIMDACADLICIHGLPLAAVEYPAFKKLLNPYILGLRTKGIEITVNQRTIKEHITKRTEDLRRIIRRETKGRLISIMTDIATRYNRSVLGVSISYIFNGEICIRTIGMHVLKASHTGPYIRDILKEILSKYGIRLGQIISVTSDNGKNIVKAIALLDAYYQSSLIHLHLHDNGEEDEYYINTDVFDQEYYDSLLEEVRPMFENALTSDLISGISCAAHCIHLVVSHAVDNSSEIGCLIGKCRSLVKILRTPTFRSKLKAAEMNMAKIDVETRWNSIFSMVYIYQAFIY